MKIERILTQNIISRRKSFDLINEWELQIKSAFNCKYAIDFDFNTTKKIPGLIMKVSKLLGTKKMSLVFVMNPEFAREGINNKSNIIPWIIDFFPTNDGIIERFVRKYNKCPLVLISSKQVYDYLKKVNCPLNLAHLPLSIPDNMRITQFTVFDKQLDVVLMGRQNPLLLEWLNKYNETHSISVVTLKKEEGHFNYYNQEGEFVGNADSREGYLSLLKKSKLGLYSTVGLDGDRRGNKAQFFSQVTPRFLEYVATGNHIMARYANNSDVSYYNMGKICRNLNDYAEFEEEMDKALREPVDMQLYSEYLEKHYTSNVISQLKKIIENL